MFRGWQGEEMKQYRLRWVIHEPSGETEGLFMAEAPDLPGCRAWEETWSEAYKHLRSVATEFIASYERHGDELPAGVQAVDFEELVVAAV